MKAPGFGKLNLGWKIQNHMFNNSIELFQGSIEFIKGLIARKLIFEFKLGFKWKK